MDTDTSDIRELDNAWAAAEQAGDSVTLDALAVPDFQLVGPLGFVLDRQQWAQRYRSGDLHTTTLEWAIESARVYGDAAVTIGTHTQTGDYRDAPSTARSARPTSPSAGTAAGAGQHPPQPGPEPPGVAPEGGESMRISINVTNYDGAGLGDIARAADEAGVDTLWVADHLIQADPHASPDGAMLEAYTTLGYLAAVSERVRLGAMVSAVTFRNRRCSSRR